MRNANRRGQRPEVARFTFNDPSLPTSVIGPSSNTSPVPLAATPRAAPQARVRSRAMGFAAPPSWQHHPTNDPERTINGSNGRQRIESSGWHSVRDMSLVDRWQAFAGGWSADAIPLPPMPGDTRCLPSLFDVALQTLFSDPGWFCATVALLPPYILWRISRYTCIYHPSTLHGHVSVDTYADETCEQESRQDIQFESITFFELVAGVLGELNYAGDGRTGKPVRKYLEAYDTAVKAGEATDSWDDAPRDLPSGVPGAIEPSLNPLLHLHISDIPVSTFLNLLSLLPPTLTRLSVLSLSQLKDRTVEAPEMARCLRKLSKQLPLLEIVDFSYNSWFNLKDQAQGVEWGSVWSHLRAILIRGLVSVPEINIQSTAQNGETIYVEESVFNDAVPLAIRSASVEINKRRKLGMYIKIGY